MAEAACQHEEEEEQTPGYTAPAKVALGELVSKDADDESLIKYKQQLLGSAAGGTLDSAAAPADDPRQVIVEKMIVLCKDREPIEFNLPCKDLSTVVKEGVEYQLKIIFKVHHEIVSGIKFQNVVSKMGVKVDTACHMMGSFGPRGDAYEFTTKSDEMPKGALGRGKYTVKSKFIDDDKKVHGEPWEWQFKVKTDWA